MDASKYVRNEILDDILIINIIIIICSQHKCVSEDFVYILDAYTCNETNFGVTSIPSRRFTDL